MKARLLLVFVLLIASMVGSVVSAQDDPGTIPEVAAETEGMSTILSVLGMADPAAVELLSSEGPLTFFAPDDAAFGTMDQDLMNEAIMDAELLTGIMLYHLVPGEWTAEALLAELEASEEGIIALPTLLPDTFIEIWLDDEGNVMVNDAMVVNPDVMASNGVIHVIDAVLVPEMPMASYVMDIPAGELGSEDNPLTLVFVPSESAEEVQTGADELVAILEEKTGLYIEAVVSTGYPAAIEALCSGEAEISALPTFSYVIASARGCADVGAVSVRNGSFFYQGQILAGADTGIETLADLEGTTFCRPNPISTSGWIIPSITLAVEGITEDNMEVVDVGTHDAVVLAVYGGECDAGATFLDARDLVRADNPDVDERVLVIGESAPIPNDTISFSTELDPEIQANLVAALVEISEDETYVEVLQNVYSWNALVPAEDAFFDDLREQLEAAGVNPEDF